MVVYEKNAAQLLSRDTSHQSHLFLVQSAGSLYKIAHWSDLELTLFVSLNIKKAGHLMSFQCRAGADVKTLIHCSNKKKSL